MTINEIEKLKKYILNLEVVLKKIENLTIPDNININAKQIRKLIKLSKAYLDDARYYLFEKNDYFTSLCCIAYAEGLIDALRFLNILNFDWPKREKPKVLIGGVFELIHPGHLHLIKEAKKLGKVVVIVARDKTVRKFKKREPIIPEAQRLEVIRNLKYVDEAYLGDENFNIEKVINEIKPDIIMLGPDQNYLKDKINKILKEKKYSVKVIQLKKRFDYYPLTSTSSIIEKVKKNIHQED